MADPADTYNSEKEPPVVDSPPPAPDTVSDQVAAKAAEAAKKEQARKIRENDDFRYLTKKTQAPRELLEKTVDEASTWEAYKAKAQAEAENQDNLVNQDDGITAQVESQVRLHFRRF